MTEKLTAAQVIDTVGDLGAERVLQIIDTGATLQELVEARMLATQEEFPPGLAAGLRTEVVHALYDILRADLIERETP